MGRGKDHIGRALDRLIAIDTEGHDACSIRGRHIKQRSEFALRVGFGRGKDLSIQQDLNRAVRRGGACDNRLPIGIHAHHIKCGHDHIRDGLNCGFGNLFYSVSRLCDLFNGGLNCLFNRLFDLGDGLGNRLFHSRFLDLCHLGICGRGCRFGLSHSWCFDGRFDDLFLVPCLVQRTAQCEQPTKQQHNNCNRVANHAGFRCVFVTSFHSFVPLRRPPSGRACRTISTRLSRVQNHRTKVHHG